MKEGEKKRITALKNEAEEKNPFAIKKDDAENPFAAGAGEAAGGPLKKMTEKEEQELFDGRPNKGVQLERGLAFNIFSRSGVSPGSCDEERSQHTNG